MENDNLQEVPANLGSFIQHGAIEPKPAGQESIGEYYKELYEQVPYAVGVNEPATAPMAKQVFHNIAKGMHGELYNSLIQQEAQKKLNEADALADSFTRIIMQPPKERKFLLKLFADRLAAQGKPAPTRVLEFLNSLKEEEAVSIGDSINQYIKAGSLDAQEAYDKISGLLYMNDPIQASEMLFSARGKREQDDFTAALTASRQAPAMKSPETFLKGLREQKSEYDFSQMTKAFIQTLSNPQMEKKAKLNTLDAILNTAELSVAAPKDIVDRMRMQRDAFAKSVGAITKFTKEEKEKKTEMSEMDKKFLLIVANELLDKPIHSWGEFEKLPREKQTEIRDAFIEYQKTTNWMDALLSKEMGTEGGYFAKKRAKKTTPTAEDWLKGK